MQNEKPMLHINIAVEGIWIGDRGEMGTVVDHL
jgi:hypothetical protein